MNKEFYQNNRKKVFETLDNNSAALIYSGKEVPQISDLQTFYVNSNYFYLTGLTEPDQLLILYKDDLGNCYERLFISESDPLKEKWIGEKISLEEAGDISGIEDISYNNEKQGYLEDLISTQDPIIGIDESQPKHSRNEQDYLAMQDSTFIDLYPILDKIRLIKEAEEIEVMKQAAELTKEGINAILKSLKSGQNEREPAALFEYIIKKNGADSLSFPTITASGSNGTILHYTKNNHLIGEEDLVLFDLGGRLNGYCSDVSRTFPANGKFSSIQKKFYKTVLETQKELIKHYKKGTKLKDLQNLTKELFKKNLEKNGIELPKGGIDDWYYHSVGHSLGLDTHDSQNRDLILENGMVITCEPGLYAKEYGIGIRIEDDILINNNDPINLTQSIPKEIEDITKIMEAQD